jgi:hypothetical protein
MSAVLEAAQDLAGRAYANHQEGVQLAIDHHQGTITEMGSEKAPDLKVVVRGEHTKPPYQAVHTVALVERMEDGSALYHTPITVATVVKFTPDDRGSVSPVAYETEVSSVVYEECDEEGNELDEPLATRVSLWRRSTGTLVH